MTLWNNVMCPAVYVQSSVWLETRTFTVKHGTEWYILITQHWKDLPWLVSILSLLQNKQTVFEDHQCKGICDPWGCCCCHSKSLTSQGSTPLAWSWQVWPKQVLLRHSHHSAIYHLLLLLFLSISLSLSLSPSLLCIALNCSHIH